MADGTPFSVDGISGTNYPGKLHNLSASFRDVECVYVVLDGGRRTVYVGETEELGARLANHHKRDCWTRKNAKYLFVHRTNTTEAGRQQIEADILAKYHFPCND